LQLSFELLPLESPSPRCSIHGLSTRYEFRTNLRGYLNEHHVHPSITINSAYPALDFVVDICEFSPAPCTTGADSVHKFFPAALTPRKGQLEALGLIKDAFDEGKKFFILEGPTGFGKSALAKAVLNLCGTGFITSPLNSLCHNTLKIRTWS
jgi:superfamily II DNA or RNA helicase